jgi:hypothetical protein
VNLLVAAGTAIVLPQRVGAFVAIFIVYSSAQAGWFLPWMTPDYVVGLMFQNPLLRPITNAQLHIALAILVALIIGFAIYAACRQRRRTIAALGLACLGLYALCFAFAVKERQIEGLGGYKSFKLVSYFVPIFGAALVGLLAPLKYRLRWVDLSAKSIVAIAIIIGFVMADKIMLRPESVVRVESQYEPLRGLERTQSVESINISGGAYWATMWMAYFLMHKKLYLENTSYYATSELLGDYDLVDKVSLSFQLLQLKLRDKPVTREINERFTLIGPHKQKIRAKLGTGWHSAETHHIWSGKDGKRSSIILHSLEDGITVGLRVICYPLRAGDRVSLQFHGERLDSTTDLGQDGREEIKVANLTLKKGDNELDFVSDLDPVVPNANDSRLVSHAFTLIEIEER